jgi:hypothetical protein
MDSHRLTVRSDRARRCPANQRARWHDAGQTAHPEVADGYLPLPLALLVVKGPSGAGRDGISLKGTHHMSITPIPRPRGSFTIEAEPGWTCPSCHWTNNQPVYLVNPVHHVLVTDATGTYYRCGVCKRTFPVTR